MARRGDLNGWWWFGIAVVGFFWRVLFRLRVEGADRVPSSGRAIVAGNLKGSETLDHAMPPARDTR